MQNLYVDTKKVLVKSLNGAKHLLEKAEGQMAARGDTAETLLQTRLAPDMFPFVKQVQVLCDNAKGAMARLSGIENPVMEDTETSLQELIARIQKTLDFVAKADEDALRDADSRKIILPYFKDKFLAAEDYARDYVLPNFFFHFSMAYAILRMKGYEIGKTDFIVGLNMQDL